MPDVYATLTEPKTHYVFQVNNERNPVVEWNRQLSLVLKQLNVSGQKPPDQIPAPLLEQIGSEIYKSLPAMLSGIGYHPSDSSEVQIMNISQDELKNIRVHFIGCAGYESYDTYPNANASETNPKKGDKSLQNSTITIKYDKLFPSSDDKNWSSASITFYGEDTSNCEPTVEAELPNGKLAVGVEESIDTFIDEYDWEKGSQKEMADLVFFKFFLSSAVIYMFFQVRTIKKQLGRNGEQ